MSGYGEASGDLVFKVDKTLKQKLMESDSIVPEAIAALFEQYGVDPNHIKGMGFGINKRTILGKFIHLDIFDGSWIEIAKLLSQTEAGHEVIGLFRDDYGGKHYIASNGKGSSVNFYFEEDSDDTFQEGFDEEAYYSEYEENKAKWISMIPKSAKKIFL
jgi:hypothetical protein